MQDAVSGLPPPPPPPPPVEGATAGPAAPAGEAQGGPPLPGPPITLPAPESADPTQQVPKPSLKMARCWALGLLNCALQMACSRHLQWKLSCSCSCSSIRVATLQGYLTVL